MNLRYIILELCNARTLLALSLTVEDGDGFLLLILLRVRSQWMILEGLVLLVRWDMLMLLMCFHLVLLF